MVDSEGRSDASFTASDLFELAGLTYRQLNDWESRGAMSGERVKDKGWRRFTPREVFALMVCAEIKSKFGVPLERCKYLIDFMGQKGANHLLAAAEMMSCFGAAVWLLTDFETVFIMDQEFEFTDLWQSGMFHGDGDRCFVLIKVSPLVNRLLAMLKNPVPPIKPNDEAYREILDVMNVRPEELALLFAVRSGEYERIEVTAADGTIKKIFATKRRDPETEISKILKEHDFQTVTVTMKNGRIVSLQQRAVTDPIEKPDV